MSNYNSKRIFEQKRWIWRGKRYIHGLVFENIQAIKCDSVPPDSDDTIFYEVPIGSSGKLTHCKGLRPWGYAKSSKSKEFKNRPILLFSCRGVCCKNIKCINISDFDVNRAEFQKRDNQTTCSLCGDEAAFTPWGLKSEEWIKDTCKQGLPTFYHGLRQKKNCGFKSSKSFVLALSCSMLCMLLFKGYLRYKTIISQNALSEAQVNIFFIS